MIACTKQLKTDNGLVLSIPEEDKTRSIRVFRLKDLRQPELINPHLDEQPNTSIWTLSRSEVIKRLNRKHCEYCGATDGHFEVHHIRKLKDVAKGKELWQQLMAARHRKTLILCRTCHHRLHTGTLPDKESLKKYVKGEPCAVKAARTGCAVRRFEISLLETGGTKEVFLSYQLPRRRKPNGTRACWASGAYLKTV